MLTLVFFIRLFFSSMLSGIVLTLVSDFFEFKFTKTEEICYWIFSILMIIAYVCVVISIFGMIWTF